MLISHKQKEREWHWFRIIDMRMSYKDHAMSALCGMMQ